MSGIIDVTSTPFPSLSGRIALITGGSSGIGLATTKLLASLKCSVLIADLGPPPPSSLSANVAFHKTDVTSYQSLLLAFDSCRAKFGNYPDIVYANAGIGEKDNYFIDIDDEAIKTEPKHEVVDIDLRAVANTIRIGWWGMRKRSGPKSIISTASFAGYQGQPGLGMYNAAKHGVVGLTRSLRYDGPKDNIAVSLVAPAITTTPLIAPLNPADFNTVSDNFKKVGIPMNTAEHIAEAVVWLVVQGMRANGVGLFVQGGKCVDLERQIAKSRDVWMGKEMAAMYKGGKGANVFEDMLDKPKSKL